MVSELKFPSKQKKKTKIQDQPANRISNNSLGVIIA